MSILVGTEIGLFEIGSDGAAKAVIDGRPVAALSPAGRARWAATPDGELLHREGAGWTAVTDLAAVLDGEAVTCLAASGDAVHAGTTGGHLVRARHGTVEAVTSFDHAPGRDRWYTPWGGPPDTRSLAVAAGDRHGDGALFANVHVGGILRSSDGGASWEPMLDIDTDVHQVIAGPGGLVLAACGHGGLALSDDGGRNWHFLTAGLHGTYCRAVARAGDRVLVSASTGPFTHQAALYALDLDGPLAERRLRRCDRGIPEWFGANIDTHWIAADGDRVAVATADGAVYASADGGRHWNEAASGLPSPTAVALGSAGVDRA